jgi:hypothetical protein
MNHTLGNERAIYAWAEEDPKVVARSILEKYQKISGYISNRGLKARWFKSFNSYYGFYYSDPKTAYGMGTAGSQGELTAVAINQYRNLIQHTLSLFTQNKVSFDAIPETSDVDGRNSAIVGNSTLEYIFEQPKYEQELYALAEQGILFGTSFLAVTWDMDKNLRAIDGDMNPVFTGELSLKSFSPLDVILEPFKSRYEDQEWVTTREMVNRYDLVALYPELEQEILNLARIDDIQKADPYFIQDPDHVWLYKGYHKATLSVPYGRYIIFGSETVIFEDKKNPYCFMNPETGLPLMGTGNPLTCFRPATIYGSSYGYTVGFDLLPLQDVKNMLASTIASNQSAFGIQNLMVARGSNFDFADVGNGLRVLEFDPNPELGPTAGAPSVLELLKTPNEIFTYNNKIDEEMEKISAINGALRGTPPPQIGSGTAMALLTTQAQTFNTQVEKAYVNCMQEVAAKSLKIIAKFMPDDDLLQLVGIKEEFAIGAFKAEELNKIQKIKVLTGNAISKSPAGRLAMAQDMLNSGQITPTEYTEVAQTGTLKTNVEDVTAEDALIQSENQSLIQGQEAVALMTDNHLKHILKHRVTLMQPDIRKDQQKQENIIKHIAKHQEFWVTLGVQNPQLLALITGSPIPPDVPAQGVTGGGQQPQPNPSTPPSHPPQMHAQAAIGKQQNPGGVGKNNLLNASTPGGNVDLAQSAMRSAGKLMTQGRK